MTRRGSNRTSRLPFNRRSATGIPSPLGRGTSSSSSPSPSPTEGGTNPTFSPSSGSETDSSDGRKRKLTSSIWKDYDCFDGSLFQDQRPRAICKHCKGGPTFADPSNGTKNFIRHSNSCHARIAGDVSQMLLNKASRLGKKFENVIYKELVALAIIRHGYSFTFAEHEGNRAIHTYLNEDCKPICRNTAKNRCLKVHKREKIRLKRTLSKVSGRICLTSDMWTSCVSQGYLSLTAHYIDDDWNLHNKIISFCHVPPPHNAEVLHEKVLSLLKEWGIHKKVFSITLDNARCNDNMQDLLAESLSVFGKWPCDGKYFHVRCGCHIMNLIVQDGLKHIGDAMRKIRELIKYVTSSEARALKFEECAIGAGVDISKSLWLDCPTRWNSSYRMLERALIYRPAFSSMSKIEKNLPFVVPSDIEWSKIENIGALLRPFDEITKAFSGRNYPTANLYLRNVWKIESLSKAYSTCNDETLRNMTIEMKKKFYKYWECYSTVLSFAAILDPRYKLQFVKFCFVQLDSETGESKTKLVKDALYKLFEEYRKSDVSSSFQTTTFGGEPDDLAAFSSFEGATTQPRSELDMYLEEQKLEHTLQLDVLEWWKENERRLPAVAKMAKDVLSIPITTVASESAFSLGGRILTKWKASLKPENAEALITTRSWVFGYDVEDEGEKSLEDGMEFHIQRGVHEEVPEEEDEEEDEDIGAEMESGSHI